MTQSVPRDVDVVIAGSGVTGLAAAVTLREGGASVALFAKPARYLRPLAGPRYYAVKARTVCLGTMGGIKISENMEALNGNGAAVLGLYAGWCDAGGMFGDSYPIQGSSGLSSAFAINSVRIAGRNALRYIGR